MHTFYQRALSLGLVMGFLAASFIPTFASADTPVSANQSSINFSSFTTPLNGSITVTATARDASGQPLSGRIFQLSSNLGIKTSPPGAVTDINGQASYQVQFLSAGTALMTVGFDGATFPTTYTVQVADYGLSASQSFINVSPSSVQADGLRWVSVTVNARSSSGQALWGRRVTLSSTYGSDLTIMPTDLTTDINGQATFNVRSMRPGTAWLTASVDGTALNQQPGIQFYNYNTPYPYPDYNLSVTQSYVSISPTVLTADGIQAVTVTVIARNASNQPLSGRQVTLSAQGNSGVMISPSSVTTDMNGQAFLTIRSTQAGIALISAWVDGQLLSQQPNIQFTGYGSSGNGTAVCPFSGYDLVKLPDDGNPSTQADSAVYFYGKDCKRHAFPNDKVFFSWYPNFSSVRTVFTDVLASMPLGKNVTYRPGVYLIKVPSLPNVYAVGHGGVLRWVIGESAASSLYGSYWSSYVQDLPESFFGDYTIGQGIWSTNDFSPVNERSNAATINDNL